GAHLEAMRLRGVKLLHGDEVIAGRVRTADIGVQDAVFVTLKANALGGFVDAAAPLLGPSTAVVFAQNGIPWWYAEDLPALDPGGRLRNSVPRQSVVGGVVYSANEVVEPGVVRNFVPGNNMLVIGDADNRNPPVVQELRRALEASGMSSPPPQDIRQAVWAKLVQNLGSASLCLLTETTTSGITEDPELKALSVRMRAEAAAIAAASALIRTESALSSGSSVMPEVVVSVSRHRLALPRFWTSFAHTACRMSCGGGDDMPLASSARLNSCTTGGLRLSASPITSMLFPGTKLRTTPGSTTSFAEYTTPPTTFCLGTEFFSLPPGSSAGRSSAYHHGRPFCANTTAVAGPRRGAA